MPPIDPNDLPPSFGGQQQYYPPAPPPQPFPGARSVSFKPRPRAGPAPKTTHGPAQEVPGLGTIQVDSTGKIHQLVKPEKEKPEKFREANDELMNVIRAAAEATRLLRKGGAAGSPIGRAILPKLPLGTTANDLDGYTDTIAANTAFETLQQMREQSPTGGAVGNVSDKDMQLLRSTISSMKPGQSTAKVRKDYINILQTYKKVLEKLPGGREMYVQWRKEWLGFDPAKRKAQRNEVQSLIEKYAK
jgi:hypothetical protein